LENVTILASKNEQSFLNVHNQNFHIEMEAIDYANEDIGAQVVEPTLQTLQSGFEVFYFYSISMDPNF